MRYEPGVYDPNMRVPVPTAFDRIVWIIVGYWFNLFGPLLVWLRWRKKNSFIGKMAVRWAQKRPAAGMRSRGMSPSIRASFHTARACILRRRTAGLFMGAQLPPTQGRACSPVWSMLICSMTRMRKAP